MVSAVIKERYILYFLMLWVCIPDVFAQHRPGDSIHNAGVSVHQMHDRVDLGDKVLPAMKTPSKSDLFFTQSGDSGQAQAPVKLLPGKSVFGWYPEWMESTAHSYRFDLLTHVAYFSYELHPATGEAKNKHGWLTSPIVDAVKAQNPDCKVLLTVTCFGNDNATFLKNPKAQERLIQNLVSLIGQRGGHGVNLDFEGIPKGYQSKFTAFLQHLSAAFKAQKLLVTVAIPAIDYRDIFIPDSMAPYVDLYVMMGYGYYGSFSSKPGPMSPLAPSSNWGLSSIASSVKTYLDKNMKASSLLVAFPYYGAYWKYNDSLSTDKKFEFQYYSTYRNYMQKVDRRLQLDSSSLGAFHIHQETLHFWGEDTTSLALKIDWVLQNKLGGIGIWALGYDDGYDDLWKVIASKMADTNQASGDTAGADSGKTNPAAQDSIPKPADLKPVKTFSLVDYKFSTLFALSLVFIFGLGGLVYASVHPDTQAALKQGNLWISLLIIYFLLMAALITVIMYCMSTLPLGICAAFAMVITAAMSFVAVMIKAVLLPRELP